MPIGAWVLRTALAQLTSWHERWPHAARVGISVNLSPRQLGHPDLTDLIADTLARTRLDPALVCLEVTESALVADATSAIKSLADLKTLGVRLAIDDFGTGYSSLSYLKQFPLDVLKIDRSFVAGLAGDPRDRSIVEAVTALAGGLGLRPVAEGVDNEAQLEALREIGCAYAQGFFFELPLPPADVRVG